MKRGYVYIMTNGPSGTLYIGVTSDITARVHQHKSGKGSAFCKQYGLTILVLVEVYDTIEEAIVREKRLRASRPKSESVSLLYVFVVAS